MPDGKQGAVMKCKFNWIGVVCLWLLAPVAGADVLGFSIGANYWQFDTTGKVRSPIAESNQVHIDFQDNSEPNFYLAFEHPLPFLPNVQLQQNNIQSAGLVPVSDPDFLEGQTVMVRGDVDLSHADLMLYYELLDNWVNLDLGLSFKYFDGHARFHYEGLINDESDLDDWIPMVYAKARFDLPFTGWSTAATVEALSFDSNKVTDIDLSVRYETQSGFGADLGYRTMDVDLQNINSFKSDLRVSGFYLGGNFTF